GPARHEARHDDRSQHRGLSLLSGRGVLDRRLPPALAAGGEPPRADELRDRRTASGALLSRPRGRRARPCGSDGVCGRFGRAGIGPAGAHLEARMTRRSGLGIHDCLALLALLLLVACDEDPARSVKIASRPVPPGARRAPPASPQVPEWQWRPELCPPPPEPAGGPGTLVASGACAFRQQGAVGCTTLPDDLILETSRPAARGATLIIYVNVEKYHGPGKYE